MLFLRPRAFLHRYAEGVVVGDRPEVSQVMIKEPIVCGRSYDYLPVADHRQQVAQVIRYFVPLVASTKGEDIAFDLPLFKLANQRNRSFGTIRSLKYALD